MLPSHTSTATQAAVQPFHGYVDTTEDALRLIEAARRGLLPRVTRRLNELERRSMIRSGAVFVFSVEESGIKRWTEGLAWSQSRISGNFLIYREVTDRSNLRSSHQAQVRPEGGHPTDGHIALKPGGLFKKTITVKIDDSDHHLISYFTQEDVRSGRLQRPTSRPELMAIQIPPDIVQSANFRYPLKLDGQHGGNASHTDNGDEIDNQGEGRAAFGCTTKTPGRTMAQLDTTSPTFSPTGFSDFSRPLDDSQSALYQAQSNQGRFETTYSARFSPQISHSMSTPGPAQTTHAHYSSTYAAPVDQMASASWSSPYLGPQESFSTGPPYHASPPISPTHAHSVHAQRDETWAQHMPASPHEGRAFSQSFPPFDNRGRLSEMPPYPSSVTASSGQPLASAPAAMPSMNAYLPEGRGREHTRTRSVPTVWPWTDGSAQSVYQPQSTSHSNHPSREQQPPSSPAAPSGRPSRLH